LKLPVALAGKVSVNVQLGIPIDRPRDTQAYRFTGSVTSPRFQVEGVEMTAVKARVNYRNGVLRLRELDGQVPRPGDRSKERRAGTFAGSARVDVVPQKDLHADLRLKEVPLERFLALAVGPKGKPGGRLTGAVSFDAPVARLREPASWRGKASVDSS